MRRVARDPRAGGVWNRVVAVQELEAMRAHDFVHPHRECKIVWRELEEWISADIDFVKEDSRQERWQAKWLTVGNEMDFVPSVREGDAKLRGDGARPAVRRVAGNSNLHSALSHHSRANASARGSSGFSCVTAADGS